jgi:hypothetical protein
MSSTATLNSRLRILVAKAFRAEKLYGAAKGNKLREAMASQTTITDAAQELRAKEWQKTHYELRVALNNILSLGNSKEQATQLALLKSRFETRAEEHVSAVRKLVENLKETADRHEFAHVLKLAMELIRLKAVAQSSKVITEELQAVLSRSGRSADAPEELNVIAAAAILSEPIEYSLPENVVSLAERRAGRRG